MIEAVKEFLEENQGVKREQHPFTQFEPWDIEKPRPEHIDKLAQQFGIDFSSPELVSVIGSTPRLFQTGYLFSNAFIRVKFAGNQIGKSFNVLVDKIMRLTGEVPTALRYEKGKETHILRAITKNNIKRFGRIDCRTGNLIDHNIDVEPNEFLWNCGTIKGAGIFPHKKIYPKGSKIWIVTYKQARDEAWWPIMKGMIPKTLLDRKRGSQQSPGFDENQHIIHLIRGCTIHFLTYEQGHTRLEAAGDLQEFENLVEVIFDEEPPDERFFNVVLQRVPSISLITTPYAGLTWTYDDIFMKAAENQDIEIFHATQFDCPYKTEAEVMKKLKLMKRWEVAARIFGLHSEQSGKPYYEEMYDQIAEKIRTAKPSYELKKIYPQFTWDNPIDIARQRDEIQVVDAEPGDRDAWEIYEPPKPGTAYFMAVDTAEGSEDERQEQDRHSAQVFRLPTEKELPWPVQVASLNCGLECDQFAPLTLYGCAYYNNCLLAPENVGKSAGVYLLLTRDWPFKFTMVVINDITKKPTEKYGFSTQANNRTLIFDMVGNMIKECAALPMFGLRSILCLKQIAGTIVGKGGRPDHKKRKRNDALTCLGIGLYVFTNAREVIQDHANEFASKQNLDPWNRGVHKQVERKPVLGSRRGIDERKANAKAVRRHR